MTKVMNFIRKHLLYRNIPEVDTSSEIHKIKNEMTNRALKAHERSVKVRQTIEKSKTYHIARALGVIP